MVKQWKNEDIIYPEDAQRWEDGLEDAKQNNSQNTTNLKNHTDNKSNPHNVTAAQTGAYTKAEADVKDAAILSGAKAYTDLHSVKKDNPHGVTAGQTGAYTKTEVDERNTSTLSAAKSYSDTKKSESAAYTDQKITSAKSEIQSGSVASANKLTTARKIAGIDFDGTKDISIPANNVGAYTKEEADSKVATVKSEISSGNVATATKLQTARRINGTTFDGTSDITVKAVPQTDTIPENADLNDYKTVGFYGCSLNVTAATIKNVPAQVAFSLVVMNAANTSITTQIFSEYTTNAGTKMWIRRCYTTTWGSWYQVAVADGTLQSGLFAQTASKLSSERTISLSGSATGSVAFDGSKNVTVGVSIADNSHKHTIANVTGLQENLNSKTNVRGHSNSTVTQISSTNLNDLAESGIFMGSTMANAPDTGWWYIQSMVHNANYITQVAYRLNSTDQKIRIRIKNNGTWQAWQTFALTTDIAPAASKLATARTISLSGGATGSASFDGSGNISIATTLAGNAPSATKLATARSIAGVSFDGTSNIAIAAGNVGAYTKAEVDSKLEEVADPSWIDVSQYLTSSFKVYNSSANSKVVIQRINKTSLLIAGVVSPTKTLTFTSNAQEYDLISVPKSILGITNNWSFAPAVEQASGTQIWLLGMSGDTNNLIFKMSRHRYGTTWTNCNAGDWLPFNGIVRLVL
ncbi:hypothetical protein [Enterococcus sp. DIV0802b]|uniref:hypothetical protein n=1 Tax=Enterococcus sp. DIV0802b TaxID=2774704 RepID=UPI003D2FF45A